MADLPRTTERITHLNAGEGGTMSNAWIQTYTGRKFSPLSPHADDVCIEDIAHALALKCRYGGHCKEFFSVAQHSVMVSRMVPGSDALWGLLHAAGEAYLPDVARPIKDFFLVHCGASLIEFGLAEKAILIAVANKFDLTYAMPSTITAADLCALERERRQFMPNPPEPWLTEKWWDGDTTPIECWSWQEAERRFLDRWMELTKG